MIKLYGASWCKPCIETKKMFDSHNVEYIYYDIDNKDNSNIIEEKHMNTIPVIEIYDNNKLVYSHTGSINTEEQLKKLLSYGKI